MFDFKALREIETLKCNERQKISIAEDCKGNKYLKREIAGDKREIYKTLKNLKHKSIPKIYYVGFDDKTLVVEEYVNGVSLSKLAEKGTILSKKLICSVALQLLSALKALHGAGIIHRDIKPDNILADSGFNVWLADYDIARIYRDEVRKDTETLGTFGYAPIEQYGMMPTDFKTDIYAFGVTLKALLDCSGIKGFLHKIADKCKRMDPSQRYENADAVIRAIKAGRARMPLVISAVAAVIIVMSALVLLGNTEENEAAPQNVTSEITEDVTEQNTEDLYRFTDIYMSGDYTDYSIMKNHETTPIFSGEGVWHYLPFLQDLAVRSNILMGKNHGTPVQSEFVLEDGVFSVSLEDEFGHSFSGDFSFDGQYDFEVLYPDNRRINAEVICHDMDGDGVEELLVGMCDCSFTVRDNAIYQYFNYSIGWVIKYDEARGFILCDGDMFSENSKLILVEGDVDIYLPNAAANSDECLGYMLEGNSVLPF